MEAVTEEPQLRMRVELPEEEADDPEAAARIESRAQLALTIDGHIVEVPS